MEVNPQLVHRILLTGPSNFESLRKSRQIPRSSFEEFRQNVLHTSDPVSAVKRAYHDHMMRQVEAAETLQPLHKFLITELHTSIRALITKDVFQQKFHLTDDNTFSDDPAQFLPYVNEAAQALSALESPSRAETTTAWMHTVADMPDVEKDVSFVTLSLLFLMDKTEICSLEKTDFYVTNVVAPRICSSGEGKSMERQFFHERFGSQPPITRDWIKSLVQELSQDERDQLRNLSTARSHLIQKGWIETILFQDKASTVLPEIFAWDLPNLESIRNTTRTAASGCALGWHASRAAKCDPDVILQEESKGAPLVKAMQNRNHRSIQDYELSVEDAVVSLARSCKGGPLEDNDTLRGQTRAVLQGQDAVMKLLDDRMRQLFVELSIDSTETPLPVLRTGQRTASGLSNEQELSPFVAKARTRFKERGLAFYALELAEATELATKVAVLAYALYAQEFLDQMILDATLNIDKVDVD